MEFAVSRKSYSALLPSNSGIIQVEKSYCLTPEKYSIYFHCKSWSSGKSIEAHLHHTPPDTLFICMRLSAKATCRKNGEKRHCIEMNQSAVRVMLLQKLSFYCIYLSIYLNVALWSSFYNTVSHNNACLIEPVPQQHDQLVPKVDTL